MTSLKIIFKKILQVSMFLFSLCHFLVVIGLFSHFCQTADTCNLTAQSVAIIVVRKQMWVHTLERKPVCECGLICLHVMAVWVFVCGRVGLGKYDLAILKPVVPPRPPEFRVNAEVWLSFCTHKHKCPSSTPWTGSWPWSAVAKPRRSW